MLPTVPHKTSQDFDCLPYANSDSKNKASSDDEWIYVPPEGRLKIERHGHAAIVHIWPSTHGNLETSAFSSVASDEREVARGVATHDPSSSKQLGIMNLNMHAALPSPICPADPPDSELQQVVKKASELPSAMLSARSIPFNPLDEPSPLGLTLRKTPSLLDLIQMKLTHSDVAMSRNYDVQEPESSSRGRKSSTSSATQQDKLKASNFPASILKVGTWERVSRYEGDLVAKCYYAKKKLVWEVLENGLKSKLEIQWSDITALKASCVESEPGILEIQVSRPPLFFKETNPQPRKHTLWQATSDFTGGQATICKLHHLKFSPGLLNRHYEKLMQCDPRLKLLSEKVLFSRDSDTFELHHEKLLQDDKKKFLKQDQKHHDLQIDNGQVHSYPSLHTILGRNSLEHAGIIPKHEPVETDDRMREFTAGSSSTSSGIDSQGHDESSYTSSKERFHCRDHTEDSTKPENQFYGKARNRFFAQFSESTDVQASHFCPSFGSSCNNRKILDEFTCHFLGDPLLPAFNEHTSGARLNLLSSLRADSKDVFGLHVSEVAAGNLFSEAQKASSLSFQECSKYGQRQPNESIGAFALGGKRLLPEEMSKSSFEPSILRIKCEPSGDFSFSIPRNPSLPQFYDPALHGQFRCPQPPESADAEYK